MSMSRQRYTFIAVLSLGLWLQPQTPPVVSVDRVVAQRDAQFSVPDSVRALLSYVTGLVLDSDSTLYLSDYQLGGIIHLESSGDFRRVIGNRGGGPGEFNSILALGLHQDSLWAMDPALVRLTLIPRQGRGATTVPFGSSAATVASRGRPQTRRGLPATVLPDGSLLMQEVVLDSGGVAGKSGFAFLLRADRNLEVLDTLARFPMGHSDMGFEYRDGAALYNQPFGDDPVYRVSSDGALLVLVSREASRRGGEATFNVTALRNGREVIFHRQIAYQPRRLLRSEVDSVVNALAHPQPRNPPTPITADSILRQLYRPAFYPPVKEVRVGRDGAVWLQVNFADSPVGVGDWLILSRKGFEMARVTFPDRFRLLEANRRSVWGVESDALDVPLVSRYQIPEWTAQ